MRSARRGAEQDSVPGHATPQAIRGFRYVTGLSQTKFGERIGVSRSSIHRWESGKSVPPPHFVAAMRQIAHTAALAAWRAKMGRRPDGEGTTGGKG